MGLMLFFSVILIVGVLTTFTDLKSKKIYNQHLVIGAGLGLIAMAYSALFTQEDLLSHLINGLAALLAGFIMHRFELWKGGDAKLFALYAFLMPVIPSSFPNVVSLLACSFIGGMLILLPVFIRDMIMHHKATIHELSTPTTRQALYGGLGRMIFYSWILFPLYHLVKIVNLPFAGQYIERAANPVVILTVMFLIFSTGYKVRNEAIQGYLQRLFRKNWIELLIGIPFGFLMRLWLTPDSLSFPALKKYAMMILVSALASLSIHSTFNHYKNYQERVPFAPILLMGCLLSYTSFLNTLMQIMHQWNAFRYH
jgi:Flp pilus assembly protein protease CpaA